MTRRARAGLLVCSLLLLGGVHAAAQEPRALARAEVRADRVGWGPWSVALLGLAAAAAAGGVVLSSPGASRRRATRRAERARRAQVLADLEAACRARAAERARTGLRRGGAAAATGRRRRGAGDPTRFEGGVSFGSARSPAGPRPVALPPGPALPAAHAPAPRRRPTLLEEIAAAERRLHSLRQELARRTSQASSADLSAPGSSAPGPACEPRARESGEAPLDLATLERAEHAITRARARARALAASADEAAGRTLDLGRPDLPGEALDVGTLEVGDDVLQRVRGLASVGGDARRRTLDLGWEVRAGEALDVGSLDVDDDVLRRVRALAAVGGDARQRTLDLGRPDLPGEALDVGSLDVGSLDVGSLDVDDDVLRRVRALAAVGGDARQRTLDLGRPDLPGEALDVDSLDVGSLDVDDDVLRRVRALAAVGGDARQRTLDLGRPDLPGDEASARAA